MGRQAARQRRGLECGFTLIEMVVATVVLAVGVAGALATFGAISRATGVAAEYDQAALLAERQLTEILALDEVPTAESGDFGEDFQQYHWETEVVETEQQDLTEVRLTVTWDSGESRRSVVVSTYVFPADIEDAAALQTGV